MGDPKKLKDGTKVLIRPLTRKDLPESIAFFEALPAEDRTYLRQDVTDPAIVERRILEMESKNVKRLVALCENEIVADSALELEGHEWKQHVGEIRLIVALPYRHKGLGMLMARELHLLATSEKVEQIVVKMMKPQTAAQSIFRRLGFREQATFQDYVKDRSGARQDLVVMRCDLKAMWRELQHFLEEEDWQRTR